MSRVGGVLARVRGVRGVCMNKKEMASVCGPSKSKKRLGGVCVGIILLLLLFFTSNLSKSDQLLRGTQSHT